MKMIWSPIHFRVFVVNAKLQYRTSLKLQHAEWQAIESIRVVEWPGKYSYFYIAQISLIISADLFIIQFFWYLGRPSRARACLEPLSDAKNSSILQAIWAEMRPWSHILFKWALSACAAMKVEVALSPLSINIVFALCCYPESSMSTAGVGCLPGVLLSVLKPPSECLPHSLSPVAYLSIANSSIVHDESAMLFV